MGSLQNWFIEGNLAKLWHSEAFGRGAAHKRRGQEGESVLCYVQGLGKG